MPKLVTLMQAGWRGYYSRSRWNKVKPSQKSNCITDDTEYLSLPSFLRNFLVQQMVLGIGKNIQKCEARSFARKNVSMAKSSQNSPECFCLDQESPYYLESKKNYGKIF